MRLIATAACLLALLVPAAGAELIQRDGARVGVEVRLAPKQLPAGAVVPARLDLSLRVGTAPGGELPRLRGIELGLNRSLRLAPAAFPRCRSSQLQAITTTGALAACGRALIGEGRFAAEILLPEQAPFPSGGRVLAFNGLHRGRPAILAHVYGTQPAPNSYTLPLMIARGRGTYPTILRATLSDGVTTRGFVRRLRISIDATRRLGGREVGYVSAGCPAAAGSGSTLFPLARASLQLAGRGAMNGTLMRGCSVAGR